MTRGHKGKFGSAHPKWKGGKIIDDDGYIRTWAPNHPWPRKGYIRENIRVMELKIGRRILPHECVHHKDHNRQNNKLSNLELMSRSAHASLHRKKDAPFSKRSKDGRFMCGSHART